MVAGGLLVSLLGAGCGKEKDASPIKLILQEELIPHRVGPATIRFTLTDTLSGQPVTNAAVQVEGNMTHPGMAPVQAEAIEVAPGDYEAPLDFTMEGDWYLLFDIRLPDGQTLTRQVNVEGVTE
jgi:hypothetical protein